MTKMYGTGIKTRRTGLSAYTMTMRMQRVRELLLDMTYGATVAEIAAMHDEKTRRVESVLHRMSDAYIDHWQPTPENTWEAVWCLAVTPAHCPRPPQPPNRTHSK